ncbi:hypothetical protein M9Y10_024418 [Tritrichomonas musculus]|uniref:Uncharacterized protein n=1 Tax=Tritrichomonas musculus TaxID=1915356 RepID=A0ABR2HBY5_9EUKA
MNDIEEPLTVEQEEQLSQLLDAYGINDLKKATQTLKKTGKLSNSGETLRKVVNFLDLIVSCDHSLDIIDDELLDILLNRASNEIEQFAEVFKKKKRKWQIC